MLMIGLLFISPHDNLKQVLLNFAKFGFETLREVNSNLKDVLYGTPYFHSLFNMPYSKDIHRVRHD